MSLDSRINVLYLIRTWALGGSHTIIRLLLKHLPQDQFNIITVPYDAPGTGDADFIRSVEAQGNSIAPERIPWQNRSQWFKARDQIAHLIEHYKIDVVHCHDTQSNVLMGLGHSRWNCGTVASPYGWWESKWQFQAKFYHYLEKHHALPNFDRVYTVSQNMKQKVMQGPIHESKIRVIHTGLDLNAMDHGGEGVTVRKELGIPQDAIVAGTVSRLFKEKGHTFLLDALSQLPALDTPLHLLIVGTGDERERLEAQAKTLGIGDKICFAGFYDDLTGALRAMDIFVQPSIDHEGFPTSVLEAQAAGLPVIASDIGGTHETMNVGTTGILVPPANTPALAEALRMLAVDTEKRANMAAAARPWIENSFTLQHMLEQIAATYHEAHTSFKARS